jgi:putative NADH-flavin reductase
MVKVVLYGATGKAGSRIRTKAELTRNELISNDKGESRISMEDYAIALVDELEKPQHERSRFTIGC